MMQPAPNHGSSSSGLGLPTIALAALITSHYYTLPLGRYSFGDVKSDFRIYDFVFIAVALTILHVWVPRTRAIMRLPRGFWRTSLWLLVLVWLSLLLTAAFGGMDRVAPAGLRAARLTTYFLAGAWAAVIPGTQKERRFLLWVVYLNIAFQAGYAALQGLDILSNPWPPYWISRYGNLPVGTLSPHHKHIGVVMLLGIAVSTTLLRTTRPVWARLLLLAMLALMVAVPLMAGSRTALLGFAGLLCGYMYVHVRSGLISVIAIGLAVSAVLWLSWEHIGEPVEVQLDERLANPLASRGLEGIAEDRLAIYLDEVPRALGDHPWLLLTGTGFQNISTFVGATGAHNNYLHVLLELGILGFYFFVQFLSRLMRTLRTAARANIATHERIFAADAFSAMLAILATMLVGESLWEQYSMFTLTGQILVVMGLAVAPLLHRGRVESRGGA